MEDPQNSQNDVFNEILISILRELYSHFGKEDMSASLEVTLLFDELQRVSKFDNLLVEGYPKIPPFELCERINEVSTQIQNLPEKYKLTSCRLSVKPGGQMDIAPVYIQN